MRAGLSLAAVAVVLLVGCGSTKTVSIDGTAGSALAHELAVQREGFLNMSTLAAGIKSKAQKRGSGALSNVTCISTGPLAAECHATAAAGGEESVAVSIASNGTTFITH